MTKPIIINKEDNTEKLVQLVMDNIKRESSGTLDKLEALHAREIELIEREKQQGIHSAIKSIEESFQNDKEILKRRIEVLESDLEMFRKLQPLLREIASLSKPYTSTPCVRGKSFLGYKYQLNKVKMTDKLSGCLLDLSNLLNQEFSKYYFSEEEKSKKTKK